MKTLPSYGDICLTLGAGYLDLDGAVVGAGDWSWHLKDVGCQSVIGGLSDAVMPLPNTRVLIMCSNTKGPRVFLQTREHYYLNMINPIIIITYSSFKKPCLGTVFTFF